MLTMEVIVSVSAVVTTMMTFLLIVIRYIFQSRSYNILVESADIRD